MIQSFPGLSLPRRLDQFLHASVEDCIRRFRSNARRFAADLPLPILHPLFAAEVIRELQLKTLVLSRNLSAQRYWMDKFSTTQSPVQEVAEIVWGRQTGHLVSTMPLANAPVLLLNNTTIRFTDTGSEETEAAERLERHLQKHLYRLIVLDDIDVLHPSWSRVVDFLAQRPETCILELIPTGGTPRYREMVDTRYPLAACIRDGMLLPMHHAVTAVLPLPEEQQAMRREFMDVENAMQKARAAEPPLENLDSWIAKSLKQGRWDSLSWSGYSRFRERLSHVAEAMYRVGRMCGVELPDDTLPDPVLRRPVSVCDRCLTLAAYSSTVLDERARLSSSAVILHEHLAGVTTRRGIDPLSGTLHYPGAESRARLRRMAWVLEQESRHLGEYMRAVCVVEGPEEVKSDVSSVLPAMNGEDILASLMESPSLELLRPAWLTGFSVMVPASLAVPLSTEFQKTIQRLGLDVVLRGRNDGRFVHLYSESADWNSRTYELLVSAAFGRGVLRCLIGAPSLFQAGWSRAVVSTQIRISGTSLPLLFNARDPRDEQHHDFPWKTMTVWDILAVSDDQDYLPDAMDWLDTLSRDWYAPADDGCLDSGLGRIHPLLVQPVLPPAEDIISTLNTAAVAHLEMRDALHRAWGREASDTVEVRPSLTISFASDIEPTMCCSTPQMHHLRNEISAYLHRRKNLRTHLSFWGALAAGVMFTELLLLSTILGIATAAATFIGYVVATIMTSRRVHARVAGHHEQGLSEFLHLVGEAVLATVYDAEDVPMVKRSGGVEIEERGGKAWRLTVQNAPEHLARRWSTVVRDLFDCSASPEAVLQTYLLNVAGRPLRELAQEQGVDLAYRHGALFPLPNWITRDEHRLASFLSAWESHIGRAAVIRTADPRDRERPPWSGRATLDAFVHESTTIEC